MTRVKRYIVIAVLTVIFLCGMVYAATSNNASKNFETGVVDIELNEFHKQGGTEAAWSGTATVMPGEKVSLIPRIENKGADCYVRAKITFKDTNKITEKDITGFGKKWYKADDGYYYYKGVLGTKDTLDIFQGLSIPKNLPKSMAGTTFSMDIQVHAIQSKNFEPKYDMAAPWGSIKIVKQQNPTNSDFTAYEESGRAFEIICKGNSKKYIQGLDKLFADIPYLMPGDNYSETLKFHNKSKNDINLYFRSAFLHHSDLTDKIGLKIAMKMDGKTTTIYDGALSANGLNQDSLLAMIPAGAEGEFTFTLSVPSELTNAYSFVDGDMKWIFSTKPITDEDVIGVTTGDDTNIGLYLILAAFAAAVLAVLWKLHRRKENGQDA